MGTETSEGQIYEQEAVRLLREQIASLNTEDEDALRGAIDLLRSRSRGLDAAVFKEKKEAIRGKGQIIPPEFDLAFLDQTALQIYLNTDTVPGDAIDEITEHEATEMVRVLLSTPEGDKPDKETWRAAHHVALINEYVRAKANKRLEKHHAWTLAYLESLRRKFPDDDVLSQAIDRQVQERTEVYEQIVARD